LKLLLDSHVLLWALAQPERLGESTRDHLIHPANDIFVSAASVWEIEIKRSTGKLSAPDALCGAFREIGFQPLPITDRHAVAAARLPRIHLDPFDRMLVAQAIEEGLILVTADSRICAYPVATLPA